MFVNENERDLIEWMEVLEAMQWPVGSQGTSTVLSMASVGLFRCRAGEKGSELDG